MKFEEWISRDFEELKLLRNISLKTLVNVKLGPQAIMDVFLKIPRITPNDMISS